MSVLKKEEDDENTGGKVGKQFLEKSGLVTFDLLGEALANVPVGDKVFEKMRGDDQGNGKIGIVDLGGDECTGGGVSDREH